MLVLASDASSHIFSGWVGITMPGLGRALSEWVTLKLIKTLCQWSHCVLTGNFSLNLCYNPMLAREISAYGWCIHYGKTQLSHCLYFLLVQSIAWLWPIGPLSVTWAEPRANFAVRGHLRCKSCQWNLTFESSWCVRWLGRLLVGHFHGHYTVILTGEKGQWVHWVQRGYVDFHCWPVVLVVKDWYSHIKLAMVLS